MCVVCVGLCVFYTFQYQGVVFYYTECAQEGWNCDDINWRHREEEEGGLHASVNRDGNLMVWCLLVVTCVSLICVK